MGLGLGEVMSLVLGSDSPHIEFIRYCIMACRVDLGSSGKGGMGQGIDSLINYTDSIDAYME